MSLSHTHPSRAGCPGDVIQEKLNEKGWTQTTLADVMDRPVSVVNRIINGRIGITAWTAHQLAEAFDTDARYWMDLETAYKLGNHRPAGDLLKAIRRRADEMSKVKHVHA